MMHFDRIEELYLSAEKYIEKNDMTDKSIRIMIQTPKASSGSYGVVAYFDKYAHITVLYA